MNVNLLNGIRSLNKVQNKNNFAISPMFRGYLPHDSFEKKKTGDVEIIPFEKFVMKYNYSEDQAIKSIQQGAIKTVEYDDKTARKRTSFARANIDLSNSATSEELEKHLKLKPIQSDKVLNSPVGFYPPVSVQYLSKLGYGDAKMLAMMIKKGYLEGFIRKTDTQNGSKLFCMADLNSKANKVKLQKLRDNNKDIAEIVPLAKMLHTTVKELENHTLNDEIEIIPRFIYPEDYKKVFYDLNNPKNREFVDKRLFELELIQKNKMTKSDLALKMKLIWYFAPRTRAIAKKLAMGDGFAKLAITKAHDGLDLTEEENKKLNSYFSSVWNQAGTAEYKKAYEWGTMAYEDYKKGGIEAIDDPELKAFILNIVNSKE